MELLKYGAANTIYIVLRETGSQSAKANPTLASGDVKISKDGGSFSNLASLPTVSPAAGVQVAIALSATELQCQQCTIRFADQTSPSEWDEQYINIHTYGHASAEHPFDLGADLSGNNVDWKFKSIDVRNSAGDAITAMSTGSNGRGVYFAGNGGGAGAQFSGGVTGHALVLSAGSTSGNGISILTTDGHGINISPSGSSKYGLNISGGSIGIRVYSTGDDAVKFESVSTPNCGMRIQGPSEGLICYGTYASQGHGVSFIGSGIGHGINAMADGGHGLYSASTTNDGARIEGGTSGGAGLTIRSNQAGQPGMVINTVNGGVALKIDTVSGNYNAVEISSTGTGDGINVTGGDEGNGVYCEGGVTSGHGIFTSGNLNGDGIRAESGSVSGHGINARGEAIGSASYGMEINGSGSSSSPESHGLRIIGGYNGNGIYISSGSDGGGGYGVYIRGLDNHSGIYAIGHGIGNGAVFQGGDLDGVTEHDGAGLAVLGGAYGNGMSSEGGSTSGHGILAVSGVEDGDGIRATVSGTGDGIGAYGGNTVGNGAYFKSRAITNGHGINAVGYGTGDGINTIGGDNGHGLKAIGGSVGGDGIRALATTQGNGIYIRAAGSSVRDLNAGEIGGVFDVDGVTDAGVLDVLKKILDDNDGADYDATTDSLHEAGNVLDLDVDGDLTIRDCLTLAAARVNGKYTVNFPSTGQMTIYKRDNTTVLTVVAVDDNGRTRVS